MKAEVIIASIAAAAVIGSGCWIASTNARERNVVREMPAQILSYFTRELLAFIIQR